MKAAVVYHKGEMPQYVDFPEPIAGNNDEVLVTVKAVAIKHLDKARASGSHYSSGAPKPEGRVVGGDGVCLLEDGTRVYGVAVEGMLAEKALIRKNTLVPIPDQVSNAMAAALPNAVMGSAMGLRFKAGIQPGDVVLVNGATGFTGRVAVQIAKYYGASKVIATGRNAESLKELLSLGADETISLTEGYEAFTNRIKQIHHDTPINIVIDYIWGRTAEILLGCMKGDGNFTAHMRYVSVGAMSGDEIQLSSANLRSADLQLTGSGLGAWPKEQAGLLFSEILPEMFRLAVEGKLKIDMISVNLENITEIWQKQVPGGKRLVVEI